MSALSLTLASGLGLLLIYDGVSLTARDQIPHSRVTEAGLASWYGLEEQGRLTASGEHFDRHQFTAASRHFALNSIVRVTNENNGRSVQVRINDRGPFIHGRILDVSEAAADKLDMKRSGTAPVKIELVAPPASSDARAR